MANKDRKTHFTPIVLAVILILGCVVSCCTIWLVYAIFIDEEESLLVDTEVAIDTSALPTRPTEEDWYQLAVQILETHEWDLPPNLTNMGYASFPCAASPTLNAWSMSFEASYFNGIIPTRKSAYIVFNHATSTATVTINSIPFLWPRRSAVLDLSKITVDCYEAFEIADTYAGQEFRDSVNDACQMGLGMTSDYIWSIRYREHDQRREDWGIRVDAITGEVERHQYPSLETH